MDCLNVRITPIISSINISIEIVDSIKCSTKELNKPFKVNVHDVTPKFIVTVYLVCIAGVHNLYELFLVEEGPVIFVDCEEFKVLKDGISK